MRVVLVVIILSMLAVMSMAGNNKLDSIYRKAYNSDEGYQQFVDASIPLCKTKSDYIELSDLYFLIGYKLKQKKDYQSAISFYHNSLKLASKYNHSDGQRRCAVNISKIYYTIGDYDNAAVFTNEALNIATETGNDTLVSRYEYDLGIIHRHRRAIDTAMVHLEKAIYGFQSIQSNYWQGLTLIELGICEYRLGRNSQAIDYYYQALNLNDSSKEIRAKVYNNHSLVLIKMGDTLRSMNLVKKAISLKESINNYDLLVTSMNNLGIYYYKTKQYDSATLYLAKAFHANKLTEIDGSTDIEFLSSYFYLDSIKTITGNKHLLVDLGVYDKYDQFNIAKMQQISGTKNAVAEMKAMLIKERIERKNQQITYNIALAMFSLVILVLMARMIYTANQKKKVRQKLIDGIRSLDSK